MPQVQTVCFEVAVRPVMAKERRFAHRRPIRRVLSAKLHNPAAYPQRASLSFHNGPDPHSCAQITS